MMQYELYEQIYDNKNKILFYKFETNNLISISTYIENFPLNNTSKYIVLNNSPTNPINYALLGFSASPTEKEHYDIILNCKLAKEYYKRIKEDDFDNCYLDYKITKQLSNNIYNIAKLQTDIYFEKYNKQTK